MKMPAQTLRNTLLGAVPVLLIAYIGRQWYGDNDEALQRQLQTRLTAALSEIRTENRRLKTSIAKSSREYRSSSRVAAEQRADHIWRESEDLISSLDTLSQSITPESAKTADLALQQWYRNSVHAIKTTPHIDTSDLAEIRSTFRPAHYLSEAFEGLDRIHFQSICKQVQAEVGVIGYRVLSAIEQTMGGSICRWVGIIPVLAYSPLYPAPGDTLEARVVLATSDDPSIEEVLMANGKPLTIAEGVGALQFQPQTPGLHPLLIKHFYQSWENDSLYRNEQHYYLRVR